MDTSLETFSIRIFKKTDAHSGKHSVKSIMVYLKNSLPSNGTDWLITQMTMI